MKKRHRWLLVAAVAAAVIVTGVAPALLLLAAGEGAPGNGSGAGGLLWLGQRIFAGLSLSLTLILTLEILAALFVFPAAAPVLALLLTVRDRRISRRALVWPGGLLLVSLIGWNLWSLFVNGAGYYFHHDFGSKVYNEGYILPFFEEMYGDELELADKNVIDSCRAVYTLRSGISGELFSAETGYYDEGAGVFDRLHLSCSYGEILEERLRAGERISLPFDQGHSIWQGTADCGLFLVCKRREGYEICIYEAGKRNDQKFEERVGQDRYYVRLENGELIFEIPTEGGFSEYHYGGEDFRKITGERGEER